MVANSHPPPRRKHSSDEWRFDYYPARKRWETYRTALDWPSELYGWLYRTFGHPGTDPETGVYSGWDYHGGWIYLYKEEYVSAFLLKWK